MEKIDIYKKMLETFSNQTKMKIIMLLAENGEMTVTQMAPHLDLGRSNLYHFVRQMVNDGMLKKPIVKPKENYVEKYYTLNLDIFGSPQYELMEKNFNALSNDQLKDLFQSVLTAYSFNLLMLAQKIGNTDEETLHKIKEYFIKNRAAMIYSVTELGEHPEAEEYMGKAVDALLSENKPHDGNVKLRIMILSLPYL